MSRHSLGRRRAAGASPIIKLRVSQEARRLLLVACKIERVTLSGVVRDLAEQWARSIISKQ